MPPKNEATPVVQIPSQTNVPNIAEFYHSNIPGIWLTCDLQGKTVAKYFRRALEKNTMYTIETLFIKIEDAVDFDEACKKAKSLSAQRANKGYYVVSYEQIGDPGDVKIGFYNGEQIPDDLLS
jgi:hypothetical protein